MKEIERLAKDAVLEFEAWSPERRREHIHQQRISWAIGELMLAYPDMSRDEAEHIVNAASVRYRSQCR